MLFIIPAALASSQNSDPWKKVIRVYTRNPVNFYKLEISFIYIRINISILTLLLKIFGHRKISISVSGKNENAFSKMVIFIIDLYIYIYNIIIFNFFFYLYIFNISCRKCDFLDNYVIYNLFSFEGIFLFRRIIY